MTTDNFCFYLQNRLIQTSQTGGQQYNDTSPFSIPCLYPCLWTRVKMAGRNTRFHNIEPQKCHFCQKNRQNHFSCEQVNFVDDLKARYNYKKWVIQIHEIKRIKIKKVSWQEKLLLSALLHFWGMHYKTLRIRDVRKTDRLALRHSAQQHSA